MRRCRANACRRPLAAQNRSGWCWRCAARSGRCADCWRPCDRRAKRCARCRIEKMQDRAKTVGPCSAPGCERRTKSACGLCRWCRNSHRPCQGDGCTERVGYYSTTGLCLRHRELAYNVTRKAKRAAERERQRCRARGAKVGRRGRSAAKRAATGSSARTTARASASRTIRQADSAGDASHLAHAGIRCVGTAE